MKRLIVVFIMVSLFTSFLGGCVEKNAISGEEAVSSTQNVNESKNESSKSERKFDAIDNLNHLCMKMGLPYSNTKQGRIWSFYDGETAITYTECGNENTDGVPKDINEFSKRFSEIFYESSMGSEKMNFTFSKEGSDKINGFDVDVFTGTFIDDDGDDHAVKAYTFIGNGIDCLVIATSVENTSEKNEKMEKDLDTFMNSIFFTE